MSTADLRLRRSFARGILLRAGTIADLSELREVDDDAALLYVQAGLTLDLPDDHEFVVSERGHWQRSLQAGSAIVATDLRGGMLGFAAVTRLDRQPYLAQLSVRRTHMRRGIGSALLYAALDAAQARGASLWLTTYDHLPWNRPFYERNGFTRVPEAICGPEMRAELQIERSALPLPEMRVAMRRQHREITPAAR